MRRHVVMQAEVDRIWRATRPTILFITHDIWEAILLGDRIISMTAGPDATFKTVTTVEIPAARADRPALDSTASCGRYRPEV